MKKIILMAVLLAGLATPLLAADTNVLNTEMAKYSYMLGMRDGTGLKKVDFEIDTNLFMRGLIDGQSGGAALMTQQEVMSTFQEFYKSLQGRQGKKSLAEGEAFLATNKNNPGVIVLTNGLQYKILKAGNGPLPKPSDTVLVNYRGTFVNGQEFDSSTKAGHPVPLAVSGVIPGWTQALEMMPVGSKWQLYVPSDLAYGPKGNRAIPPNSALIFDIELLNIEAPKAPRPPMAPAVQNPPLTSDIIKVPSADELKKGAKIEVIKPEDVQKMQAQSQTNAPAH